MVKCVVSGCPNRSDHRGLFGRPPKRFFPFPKDEARVKVWLAALRETEKQDSTEQQLICEDHFLSDDITVRGVSDGAIPIMSPYLDGPLTLSPWAEESSSEEEEWMDEGAPPESHPIQDEEINVQPEIESPVKEIPCPQKPSGMAQGKKCPRADVTLGKLTKRFLELLLVAPDGIVDLNQVTTSLKTRKRRVYDVTNVLDGIHLIKKESASKIKWVGKTPVSNFLIKNDRFLKEMANLKTVEETLDGLIKTCAHQLFDMTDDPDNIGYAYVTHDDISRIKVFQEQTVIVIKAPEETKLEVPTPKEDSIQVHLKGGRGAIDACTCEMEGPVESPGSPSVDKTGCFVKLEQSRIKTALLQTEALAPQTAVQSA